MPRLPTLEQFLCDAFSAGEIVRWAEMQMGHEVVARLPGVNSPPQEIAGAVARELRRRRIPAGEIFASLRAERPHHHNEIDAIARDFRYGESFVLSGLRTSGPWLAAGFVALVLLAWSGGSWDDTASRPEVPVEEPAAPPLTEVPVSERAAAPGPMGVPVPVETPAVTVPALSMTVQGVVAGSLPRFCHRQTYELELVARRALFVVFVNLFDGKWLILPTAHDADVAPNLPTRRQQKTLTDPKYRDPVPESLVALAFDDTEARREYRARFSQAPRTGAGVPTPDRHARDTVGGGTVRL